MKHRPKRRTLDKACERLIGDGYAVACGWQAAVYGSDALRRVWIVSDGVLEAIDFAAKMNHPRPHDLIAIDQIGGW